MLYEHEFSCPYCSESITMILDLSVDQQLYIEDCEVCCRPIQVDYRTDGVRLTDFRAANDHN